MRGSSAAGDFCFSVGGAAAPLAWEENERIGAAVTPVGSGAVSLTSVACRERRGGA